MKRDFITNQIFEVTQINPSKKKYVQIKHSPFEMRNKLCGLIQIIDISSNILYQQEKSQNEFLSLINACVSHELRNPLNSIKA